MKVSLRAVLFVAAALIIVGACALAYAQVEGGPIAQPQACTAEAMICPDGSAVGRTGPNCSFAPCPTDTASTTTTTTVTTTTPALLIITSADGNTKIALEKGQEFEVALGSNLNWRVAFDPASAIVAIAGANAADGSQGVYEAMQAGRVDLSATGAPICKAGEACPDFMVAFMATLIVGN